jgi:hypothetical protein
MFVWQNRIRQNQGKGEVMNFYVSYQTIALIVTLAGLSAIVVSLLLRYIDSHIEDVYEDCSHQCQKELDRMHLHYKQLLSSLSASYTVKFEQYREMIDNERESFELSLAKNADRFVKINQEIARTEQRSIVNKLQEQISNLESLLNSKTEEVTEIINEPRSESK